MARDMPEPPAGPSPGGRPDVADQGAADPAGAGQPPGAVEAPPPVAAAEGPQPAPKPGKPRKLLYVTLPGCWGALIFACLSFTPSLLPRGGIVQGLIWGITAAIGYGLGVLAAWIWRAFADRDPRRPRRRSWLALLHQRGRPGRGVLRARAVLAVRDPQADGGDGLQHPARRRLALRRGADLLPPPADRARPARPVPLGRDSCSTAGSAGARRTRSAGSWWPASPTWWSPACCCRASSTS